LAESDGLKLFADQHNEAELLRLAYGQHSVAAILSAHLQRLRLDEYFALLAFLSEDHKASLEAIRTIVRDRRGVATSLGFGPRYLHSTGQAQKGGPNTGVFLEVTCGHPTDLPVPGHRYTFGVVEAAQARGDFNVLAERGRRLLRVHLRSDDVKRGLATLRDQVGSALK
jgi:transaldolase/glucose-6-phosphate isomerase